MNKKMREIQAKILEKTKEAQSFTEGETKDLTKAAQLLDEVDELQKEFDVEARLYEKTKGQVIENPGVAEPVAVSSEKAFADAARRGFKGLNEGTPADGGYTVPEDIQTRINTYRSAKKSLLDLVTIVPVTTLSGARTFKKRAQQTGFSQVGEGAAIGGKATPQFERMEYTIKKYAGYFPMTSEVLADSDANLVNEIVAWAGDESRVTANKLILAQVATKDVTDMEDLDDIKYALNVTLGQAFKPTSKVVTNDEGLQFLDTLKDGDGEYLLQPTPNDPMKLQLCAGATIIPVEVVPSADLPCAEIYNKTADTAIVAGHTYYTRSGSEGAYVYTVVENPVAGSLANYYNKFNGVPMIIGDLKEGIVYWDRQQMTLKQSDIAVVGSGDSYLNAFEEDLMLIRAIEREDVGVRDAAAFVRGQIQIMA